jgi:hypothetical protein
VALALTGIWAMYYSALGKSANTLAANHLARTVVEGALAQGYDWIITQGAQTGLVYNLERRVRGRVADCQFSVDTVVEVNTGQTLMALAPEDLCKFTVTVKWKEDRGNQIDPAGFNNMVTYSAWVYRGAQQ